jgi:hypothetical protein
MGAPKKSILFFCFFKDFGNFITKLFFVLFDRSLLAVLLLFLC